MNPSDNFPAFLRSLCIVCLLFFSIPAHAQQRCPLPVELSAQGPPNIFTQQQEIDLGDVEAERIERTSRVIYDDDLAANLNRIVARILAQLPPTQLRFRVMLIDLPEVNAFSLPGGRIYVTRKIVAFARNENELAALLSHEMGHILSHQGAIDMTRNLRVVLGVTSVDDRKDIEEKFNRLLDNMARFPKLSQQGRGEEEPHQLQADRVGLFALANAGYSPGAPAELFDRLAQTKGRTGGWMSDLFGLTTPNEKRLREMRRSTDSMPAACREQPVIEASDEFLKWQSDVISYSGLGRKEALSGVLDKRALDPPLRDDITNFKFSPDGKYVLGQDPSSIFVLSRDPFRLLFRVDAPRDTHTAHFTPDSENIVFSTRGLRIEEWNVATQERTAVHELAIPGGCVQSLLSPDGKILACINGEFDLTLYDVAQGSALFTAKKSFAPNQFNVFAYYFQLLVSAEFGRTFEWVHLAFSPDGTAFLAANRSAVVAVDVQRHEQIQTHGALTDMVKAEDFAFLGSDRLIAVNRPDPKNSAIFKFPSGDVIRKLVLGGDTIWPVTHGDDVVIGPLKDAPIGILDLPSNKLLFGSPENHAVDAYDGMAVAESRNGEIALYNLATRTIEQHVPISLSPLGGLRATAVSSDLQWIALSGDIRGAVWDVSTAKRAFYTRGFHGAYFDGDKAMYADFPKREPQGRMIARLSLGGTKIDTVMSVDDQSFARQRGPYLVVRKPAKGGFLNRNVVLEVQNVEGGQTLWTHPFPKNVPPMTWCLDADALLMGWQVNQEEGKDELKSHPALQKRLAGMRDRETAWLLESFDARTGKEVGAIVVDTGKRSFEIENARAAGDWITLQDTQGRTLVYSISTGEQKGAVFGTRSLVSASAAVLSVENQPGQLDIYDLPSVQKRGELIFPSPIWGWWFSDDGKRMLVLTSEQTTYTFDTAKMALGATQTAPATAQVSK